MKNILIRLFYKFLVRPWLTFIIGVNFNNQEIFENLNQYIIVANHNSHFDMVSILAALPGIKLKTTKAVAASDYFGKSDWVVKAMHLFLNSILISRDRNENEPSAIDILDVHLKHGNSLVMFPEGSRGKPGLITNFKKGIAILLKNNPNIPFIPVYLDGFGRVLPKDSKVILPLVCKVRFGKPVFINSDDTNVILSEVKAAIFDLQNNDERDRNKFDF